MTQEDEIKRVHGGGAHVVILGAGASIASTLRDNEKNNMKLPAMNNIVDVLNLHDILNQLPDDYKLLYKDFEKLYSRLCSKDKHFKIRFQIENKIYNYFEQLELPDKPTIYDYLIMSLRYKKDVIASFNWDPFLYQAYVRNGKFTKSPGILFLHGNVSIGYSKKDMQSGPAGWYSKKTKEYFEPTKLLYPVDKKEYNSDEYIKSQWDALSYRLKNAKRVTVFGYRAPETDVEAISLMSEAWGTPDERNLEQFELIDTRNEEDVTKSWTKFIHTHHYDFTDSFFKSSIANHPRRTVESYRHWAFPTTPDEAFQEGNKVPETFNTLDKMWDWYKPLIDAEAKLNY
jgi:hypothetical protein